MLRAPSSPPSRVKGSPSLPNSKHEIIPASLVDRSKKPQKSGFDFNKRDRLLKQLLETNAQLSELAATDALTGLPNRRALLESLRRQLAQANRQNSTVLVAFLDFDGFKDINDRHGHSIGDAFLSQMAGRLRQALRPHDIVARYGGDEFAIIGPGPAADADPATAIRVFTERIATLTVGLFSCRGIEIHYTGASVGGIAVLPHDNT